MWGNVVPQIFLGDATPANDARIMPNGDTVPFDQNGMKRNESLTSMSVWTVSTYRQYTPDT